MFCVRIYAMNTLNKKQVRVILIILILAALFYLSGYFFINGGRTNLDYKDHHIRFNDGWTVTYDGNSQSNVSLPVDVATEQGKPLVFTKTLPSNIPENYALITRNYHQILKVKVGGEQVFSYPNEDWTGMANVISDEWCLIELGPEDSGKEVEVSFNNTTIFKFNAAVGDFYYGSDNSLVQYVHGQGFPGLIMGIIVSIIAGLLLIASYVYRNHTNQSQNTAIGVALMGFGIWLINRAKMCVFPVHSIYAYWGSLLSLMLVAPFVFLYSYFRNEQFKRTALWGFRLCLAADVFLVISSTFIKYDVEIICMFAYGLSIIGLFLNTYSLFLGGFGEPSKKKTEIEKLLDRTEFLSTLIIPFSGIFEMLVYPHYLWTEASMFMRSGILLYAIFYMIFFMWRTYLVVQDRTIVTKQLHDSQLELMMGQIQPHFIFNTLSSIRTLVMVDPKLSYNMLYDFSNYLRANIDNVTNLDGIKFSAEVEHIKSYVNIEKVRFGNRLNVEYEILSDNFTVPPLSIQPLVENAVKHGVCKKVDGGTVVLRSYSTPEYNVVEVDDNGVGFNAESAGKVFSVGIKEESDFDKAANKTALNVMNEVINSLDLRDRNGNRIEIKEPTIVTENLSGNGSEQHQSTGMMNIFLRLREMADAKVEIESTEGVGTKVKVLFPKDRDQIKQVENE